LTRFNSLFTVYVCIAHAGQWVRAHPLDHHTAQRHLVTVQTALCHPALTAARHALNHDIDDALEALYAANIGPDSAQTALTITNTIPTTTAQFLDDDYSNAHHLSPKWRKSTSRPDQCSRSRAPDLLQTAQSPTAAVGGRGHSPGRALAPVHHTD